MRDEVEELLPLEKKQREAEVMPHFSLVIVAFINRRRNKIVDHQGWWMCLYNRLMGTEAIMKYKCQDGNSNIS